ncbi:MAG: Chromosomal replication initiator, DnaA C-terminal domain [Bryobacterales bacterium]|nr:Chromosomal replication initiator, DnaA C-terminal domain [Bryobacterales bacterium]
MPGNYSPIWQISLAHIEAVVSSHLGPGRVSGSAQGPSFSRHISMYLAKRVAGWSLSAIGRFYNRRHHTTVLYAVSKIEQLRSRDEGVDALLDILTEAIRLQPLAARSLTIFQGSPLVEAVATRVIERLANIDSASSPGTSLAEPKSGESTLYDIRLGRKPHPPAGERLRSGYVTPDY